MRYVKKLNLYKDRDVTFNPANCQALSYDWFRFMDRRRGLVLFNSYAFGRAISRHQEEVRKLVAKLGINIDIELKCPIGLQDMDAVVRYYKSQIETLTKQNNKKFARHHKNLERDQQISHYQRVLEQLSPIVEPVGGNVLPIDKLA